MSIEDRPNRPGDAELSAIAHEIRKDVVKMVGRLGQGYVQQGLGATDLFTYLYFAEASLDPDDPLWPERDRIFLSTAHNSAVFHATLARRGMIDPDKLESYTKDGSTLEINVSERLGPVVEATCGSLGQGLSVAAGMALSMKRRGLGQRIYVILGDGELQEGQTWEACMVAASQRLGNLCLIVDVNRLQVEGETEKVASMEPLDARFESFGWAVHRIDGHDFSSLRSAFDAAREERKRPTVILAETLVGKGVPFLEGKMSHNMVFPPDVARDAFNHLEAQA
jgi:transketolase